MRLILDMDSMESLHDQVSLAKTAMAGGIKEGEMWGAQTEGKLFGIKRNKGSIRVYPQQVNT